MEAYEVAGEVGQPLDWQQFGVLLRTVNANLTSVANVDQMAVDLETSQRFREKCVLALPAGPAPPSVTR